MADKRFADLPAATSLGDADLLAISQAGNSKKLTGADLQAYAQTGALTSSDIGVSVQAYDANLPTWPSAVSATEVGYLDGVTSAIQTQINTKASTGKAIAMSIVFGG